MIWTSDALAAELQHAGFTVQRVSETATPTPGQVCIRGVVKEFFADMTTQVVMKVRVSFTVARDNNTLLDQAFDVDEGLGMFSASDEDYEKLANQALERLMRRAAPVIIAALQKTTP
jgi:hypothetical protein